MYYIDPQKRKFVDIENSGQELHSDLKPRFFYGQADTVDIQFGAMVAGVWTPQAFNATDGFQFGADTNFAHTDDLLFLSEGADVTIVDAATGTISVAVDCFTVAFLAKITTQDTSAYLELKRLVSGESRPRIMMQDICYCSPAVIDTEGDPEAGDRGKAVYDHVSATNNPHGVTASQVGLGNVEDKSSATIRGEITAENVTDGLGYVPLPTPGVDVDNSVTVGRALLGYDNVNSDVAVLAHVDAPTKGLAVASDGSLKIRAHLTMDTSTLILNSQGSAFFNQEIFVDPAAGSDDGNGSFFYPVATIAEAISRVQTGRLNIYLKYDTTYIVSELLPLRDAHVYFMATGTGTIRPTIVLSGADGYIKCSGRCAVSFKDVIIDASGLTHATYRMITCTGGADVISAITNCAITGNGNPFFYVYTAFCKVTATTDTFDSTGATTGNAIYYVAGGGSFMLSSASITWTGNKYATPALKTWL